MNKQMRPPNILLIMDDQHRYDYLGCAGAEFVRTPNLDRLAARGTRIEQCVTNSPLCVPSRVGLTTGLQPFRLGALDNDFYLPASVTTLFQRLRDNNYRVHLVGKLDLAKPDHYNGRFGDRPAVFRWGFTHPEECEGKIHAGISATPLGPYTHYLRERGLLAAFHADYSERGEDITKGYRDSILPADAFADCYIGRRAAQWIEEVPDDFPWFSQVSFVGPHDPYDPPREYSEQYRSAPVPPHIPGPRAGKPAWLKKKHVDLPPEEVAVTRRQYCAAIQAIDDQVGLIMQALERRGMVDNTYVIFTSDHGDMIGDHDLFTKWVPYEASVRVPLIVAGPGIPAGRSSQALVELIDVNPTVCELAGLPPQGSIDALSFCPVLFGRTDAHRQDTLSMLRHFRMLRTERYKYIENENDITELYDLWEDPRELHNIAPQHRDTVQTLSHRLRERIMEGAWHR